MSSFWKVTIGFIGGVIFAVGAIFLVGILLSISRMPSVADDNDDNSLASLTQAIERLEIQYFDLPTKRGEITLHTLMPKDSVKILMGRPSSIDVRESGLGAVYETWEYKGRNHYIAEFTFEFVNGRLKSVRQYREPY